MDLAEIVERFKLDGGPATLEEVVKSLRKRLGELHPDRHGGDFPSAMEREEYLAVQATVETLARTTALVPLTEVTALVQALTASVTPLATMQEETFKLQRAQQIRGEVRALYHGPRVTSATFLAISTAILAFMGSLKDNPILGEFLASPIAKDLLLGAWLSSAMCFVIAWMLERRATSRAEFLSTDEGLAYTLRQLRDLTRGRSFSQSDLIYVISGGGRRNRSPRWIFERGLGLVSGGARSDLSSLWIFGNSIGFAAAEAIANSQIEKLLAREVITRSKRKGLREMFEIDSAIDL